MPLSRQNRDERLTPNISFAYGGGPTGISDARTLAIRGITGQNLFGTAGGAFYIDDTPIPGSVDPRVLDIDNLDRFARLALTARS